ncbi:C-type lectin domain family 5 member A-like [Heteronotia binoei]|uniref:C-type lectin domain family 5 member A-like n=1 Tax=Heteronotia binoei TaxID=13085 RepID=UPI002930BEAB|nr:C-type lectin domain family 5 member A-like [Heteronotia binoei]
MNWNLVIQVVTTVILKLIASCLFMVYFPQIFYTPVLKEEPNAVEKDCPVSWRLFEGKCYFFAATLQTWELCQETCAKFSSQLAIVNSKEELVFLKSRTQFERHFIGLTQRNGRWTWIDGTEFDHSIFSPFCPTHGENLALEVPWECSWDWLKDKHYWFVEVDSAVSQLC